MPPTLEALRHPEEKKNYLRYNTTPAKLVMKRKLQRFVTGWYRTAEITARAEF